MDIVEAMQLFGAPLAGVGGTMALRLALAGSTFAGYGTEFQRTELIIANDCSAFGTLGIQRQNLLFFALKSESWDCFQVFVRCHETSARRNNCRNHSALTAGKCRRLIR